MRVRARDSTALGIGSAVSGLLAYVFFAIVTRALGAEAAAPVSVLWTYWAFAAAALTFPVQHWIVRSVVADGAEGPVRAALPRVTVAVVAVAATTGLAAWLMRATLFGSDDVWFPLLVAAVTAGSALVGLVRGSLTARRRFGAVALALVGENLVRAVLAAVLAVTGSASSLAYGVVLVVGQVAVLLWPSALRLAADQAGGRRRAEWAGFLGGAAGGQVVAQTVLTGGPVVVALVGGAPVEVTALFAGLALFRAPYTLAQGMVGQATGALTALVVGGRHAALNRVRQGVVAGTALAVAVAALLSGFAGPWLVATVFGEEVVIDRAVALAVAVGSAVALGNLALSILALAHDRPAATVRAWVPALVVAGATLLVVPGSAGLTTSVAFAAAEAVAFLALLASESRRARR